MILEINRGQIFLDGQIIDPKERLHLTLHNQEYKVDKEPIEREENQYILIDSEGLTINTSWFGESPLFHYQTKDYFVCSSSFVSLLCRLRENHLDEIDFDRIGILESIIFDNPLRARTLFKGIKKAIPGRQINISAATLKVSERTLFVLPFDKGEVPAGNFLLDKAVDMLDGLSGDLTSLKGDVLLPLSGGLDSRLLACLMSKNNVSYDAITFGPKESTEPYIAKTVARKLNVPICHLELRNDYYKQYGDEVTWLTGGLSSHMHCHLYSVLSENQVNYDNIVHGYLGGEYAGASQPEHACNYSMSEDEALHRYTKHFVERAWIWGQLSAEDRDEINNDLAEIMSENCQCNLPCHFEEYVHNVDRQFSLIANVFSSIEKFGLVSRPFASKEYAIFFNSLPFELRKDRKLFIEASNLLFPEMSKIGTQNQIYDDKSIIGKIEKQLSLLISKVSYASLLLTNGKLVVRNPKAYERHRELLQSELKNDFDDAITEVSDLLGIRMTILTQNSVANRHQTVSQFRTLSLYSLLNSVDEKRIGITRRCT